jgi:predicted transposase/invertase (TIGR01784 family)
MNRAAFCQSMQMPRELSEGQSYDNLPDMISIWFTTYKETKRRYHTSEAMYMFQESSLDPVEIASEKFRIFIVELEKVDLSNAKADNMFDVWSYFLIAPEKIPEEFLRIEEVKNAMSTLSYVSHNKDQRRMYNSIVMARNDSINAITHAKKEGIVIGELKKAKKVALSSLQIGMGVDIIAKISGLSVEEIESLKNTTMGEEH